MGADNTVTRGSVGPGRASSSGGVSKVIASRRSPPLKFLANLTISNLEFETGEVRVPLYLSSVAEVELPKSEGERDLRPATPVEKVMMTCYTVVTLLLHCCYTVVTLLLHCCYTAVTLLLHCRYTVVTLLLHCCYTVVTLLLHCCYAVVTLLLHCCYIVVTLLLHCCSIVVTVITPLLNCR
jgi:hypothetical protein